MKYLIAGLGNIGEDYENTRHNIGFDIIDALAEQAGASFSLERHAFHTLIRYRGKSIHLIKPTTFMNLSGKAVRYWLQEEKIPLKNLLVLVDDLDLPFGKLRLKPKGGPGSHNGLINIQDTLGTGQYSRIRFGIGSDFGRGRQVNYVLGSWNEEEQLTLQQHIKTACDLVYSFVSVGPQNTMNKFN